MHTRQADTMWRHLPLCVMAEWDDVDEATDQAQWDALGGCVDAFLCTRCGRAVGPVLTAREDTYGAETERAEWVYCHVLSTRPAKVLCEDCDIEMGMA